MEKYDFWTRKGAASSKHIAETSYINKKPQAEMIYIEGEITFGGNLIRENI